MLTGDDAHVPGLDNLFVPDDTTWYCALVLKLHKHGRTTCLPSSMNKKTNVWYCALGHQ
jgi:hypothetical protein